MFEEPSHSGNCTARLVPYHFGAVRANARLTQRGFVKPWAKERSFTSLHPMKRCSGWAKYIHPGAESSPNGITTGPCVSEIESLIGLRDQMVCRKMNICSSSRK